MESNFPYEGMTIMTNRSGEFTLMQIISNSCPDFWPMETDGILYAPDSINCKNLSRWVFWFHQSIYNIYYGHLTSKIRESILISMFV